MRQLWTQAAVIALSAGTLSACATAPQYSTREGQAPASATRMPTPNFPITQPPSSASQGAAPQATAPEAGAESDAVATAPTVATAPAPVQSQPLAPVTQSELPPPAPARAAPQPTLRSVPPRTVVTTSVTGPVVEVDGKPQVHVVKSGDTLTSIAKKFGVNVNDLAKDNAIKKGQTLRLGQKINGPASEQKAYVVQTGDTMFAIAKRFTITASALAEENDLSTGASIRKGQRLLLPDGYKDKGPVKTTSVVPGTAAPETAVAEEEAAPAPTRSSVSSRPSRQPAAEPTTVSTTSLSVTGAVVEVAGKRQVHTVKSGDTLTSIAKKFDVNVNDLAEDNNIKKGQTLRLGQKIKGPASEQKAYVAQSGDTLAEIGKRFGVTARALAAENGLRATATIKKGQKIRLPDGFRDKGPLKTTTTVARPAPAEPSNTYARVETPTPAPSTPSAPVPYTPSYPRPSAPVAAQPVSPPPASSRPIIESSAAPTEAEIIASGKGKFDWPLRGEVISDFGVKGTGQRNDGLNIRAPQGTPVLAAADGEIAYAGNQVPTFGNLVLVKHADGWVTAYAHLSSTTVKMRQQVRRGEQIGAVGATGGVNEPQLHFEMRYAPTVKDKAKPVDPGLLLPR
ncbi:LysM peptidoglycan-binding domain-containing protein [Caulobacter segnis]|uniref:Peptidase M23 n=2 Tax=Caulobacter segnis TaxID=88688 RepID=D5VIV7_CAUST|nr:LysM peptidoglycan-binding domain-containing M23 family metallopeptidase [Caulobacter segnis]ADG09923.1 Peptidase M23 [Caulobacter segnis ATCC 21756]AVQ01679.1 LysM peptidoglycan-binding domain-containing protein [Caulobacter segnis]